MTVQIVVADYGAGNVRSACRALEKVGATVTLSADPAHAREATGLVVPGVGAFAAVMDALEARGIADAVRERVAAARPVFGICVGMQVLAAAGVEGGQTRAGLGIVPGEVSALDAPIVPHMGWAKVAPPADSTLFTSVADQRFYFVHSYALQTDPGAGVRTTWARHGGSFVAAIETDGVSATQFHPEKSGAAGQRVLANWLATL